MLNFTCSLDGDGCATDYADRLLSSLGVDVRRDYRRADVHPAISWARSGAMSLTGRADGSPQMCPVPLASCVEGVLAAFTVIAGEHVAARLPGAAVLSEHAACAGLRRNGAISPGGGSRLLRTADGWLAVSLTRSADWELVPAWLEDAATASWDSVTETVGKRPAALLLERGRLLGLAVALAGQPSQAPVSWHAVMLDSAPGNATKNRERPLVIDLSSLWAGPLCGHLLQIAGAQVVKVESRRRPDGARNGSADFYNLLNHGKASVALDFAAPRGLDQLRRLLLKADIVIEASRPRALRQLGIDAEHLLAENPGLTWLSITGYGRSEPQANWIAYGDDAGVAAGLSGLLLDLTGNPIFCSDAIADPLTGLHAALAALASFRGGGGRLIALSLHDVLSHCSQFTLPDSSEAIRERWRDWRNVAQTAGMPAILPAARIAGGTARPLGADTSSILTAMEIPC